MDILFGYHFVHAANIPLMQIDDCLQLCLVFKIRKAFRSRLRRSDLPSIISGSKYLRLCRDEKELSKNVLEPVASYPFEDIDTYVQQCTRDLDQRLNTLDPTLKAVLEKAALGSEVHFRPPQLVPEISLPCTSPGLPSPSPGQGASSERPPEDFPSASQYKCQLPTKLDPPLVCPMPSVPRKSRPGVRSASAVPRNPCELQQATHTPQRLSFPTPGMSLY